MKIIKFFQVIVLFYCFITFSSFADTAAINKLNSLMKFRSYQANFKSKIIGNTMPSSHQSGRFYLKKPSLLRWEVLSPNHQIMLVDGKSLAIYDVDLMQVTKEKLENQFNPAVLLNDSNVLSKQFTVTQLKIKGIKQAFSLKPKSKGQFNAVILGFNQQGQLVQMRIKNNLAETNVFDFSNIKVNQVLSDGLFHMKYPKGVDVVTAALGRAS